MLVNRNTSIMAVCMLLLIAIIMPSKMVAGEGCAEDSVQTNATVEVAPLSEPQQSRPLFMSLRTNMLYDLLLVPNIGIEFYLNNRWSVAANWMYAWWSNADRHRYWRICGGDISVRRWFGSAAERKPLTGHHIGLYGQILTYDIELGGKGQMAGQPGGTVWDQMHYAFGVDYGYSLPIAERLNLDFTIGIGYMTGTYYDYEPLDDHFVWGETKRRKWFGPTKLEVSLVWLLGSSNRNAKKGGAE